MKSVQVTITRNQNDAIEEYQKWEGLISGKKPTSKSLLVVKMMESGYNKFKISADKLKSKYLKSL